MGYAQWILNQTSFIEEIKEIEKAEDYADISCILAGFAERKGSGYYD